MGKVYEFYAIGRKKAENSFIHRIEFPGLNLSFDSESLPEPDRVILNTGFARFLEDRFIKTELRKRLEQLDDDDETINPLSELEIRKKHEIGSNDRLEVASIQFQSKHRSNYCERFLSPVMKATLTAELILFIPLIATAIGTSEMELFGADDDVAKQSGTALGLLFAMYNLISVFAGPGANNMSEFGANFDSAFHSIWRTLTCKKSRPKPREEKESGCNTQKAKVLGAKALVTSFFGAFLYSDVLLNFQQFRSMEDQIAAMEPYSIFPVNIIDFSMRINFYLNQINDPIFGSSFLSWCYAKIDERFRYHGSKIVAEEKKKEVELLARDNDAESLLSDSGSELGDEEEESAVPPRRSWCCFFSRSFNREENNKTASVALMQNR